MSLAAKSGQMQIFNNLNSGNIAQAKEEGSDFEVKANKLLINQK